MQTLWPITSQQRGYGPSLEVTAVKLAVKFVQKVSSWLEQLPEDWREEPYEMFAVTMAQAIRAMTRCAMLRVADNDALQRVGPNRMVRYAPLMQSAVYHQALCIALFYNVHAQLMYTQRCADFAASKSQEAAAAAGAAAASSSSSKGHTKGSSTSSSSSKKKKKKPGSSSKGANAAAAAAATASPSKQLDSWGRACELAGGLPECELLLLRELGCSARAVLWAAAAASPVAVAEMPALNITALEMAYKQVRYCQHVMYSTAQYCQHVLYNRFFMPCVAWREVSIPHLLLARAMVGHACLLQPDRALMMGCILTSMGSSSPLASTNGWQDMFKLCTTLETRMVILLTTKPMPVMCVIVCS